MCVQITSNHVVEKCMKLTCSHGLHSSSVTGDYQAHLGQCGFEHVYKDHLEQLCLDQFTNTSIGSFFAWVCQDHLHSGVKRRKKAPVPVFFSILFQLEWSIKVTCVCLHVFSPQEC